MSRSTTRWGAVAIALAALLAAAPTSVAQEVGDPEDVVEEVTDAAAGLSGQGGGSTSAGGAPSATAAVPPQPTADNDTGAHETSDPAGSDHASGSVLDVDVAGEDAVDVGGTDAEVQEDGDASGDVTVLAIGGNEIVGAHSDSESGPQNDEVDPFQPICDGSGGGVCVGLLFAETSSSNSGGSSSAESQAALAFACLGGTDPEAGTDCEGPVSAGVATSSGSVEQNNRTGDTTAEQETAVADACVGGEDEAGTCEGTGVEILAARSRSRAPSDDGPGTTSASSCTADLQIGGSATCIIEDPEHIEVPPGCPEGQSLLCVYVNQGETFVFTGGAGSHQEALHVDAVPGGLQGSDLLSVHAGDAETLATNSGPRQGPDVAADDVGPGAGPDAGPAAAAPGAALAFTGGWIAGLLAALVVLVALGAGFVEAGRRRGRAAE